MKKLTFFNIHNGLWALAMGGFAIGTTELVTIGLLPNIAESFNINIPKAGHLISIYALGVVIGAPLLTSISTRFPPKVILMTLIGAFVIFNALSALSINYAMLLLFRFLAGLPHGAFFGVGAVVAGKLAQPGKSASAIAIMFGGLTLTSIIGAPFSVFIGQHWGWRFSFGIVAIMGLVAFIALRQFIPSIKPSIENNIRKDLSILKRGNLWLSILITSIGFGGYFAWMSYLTPLLIQQAGYSENAIPYLMAFIGIGLNFGNWLGGKLADYISPLVVIIALMISLALTLGLGGIFSSYKIISPLLSFLYVVISTHG